MIWIIAGTSEAREVIESIEDLDSYIATVATEEAKEFIPKEKLIVGRMNYKAMGSFIKENNISLIVDLSHPYASVVSNNAKRLAEYENIKYIRYTREKTKESTRGIYLNSYEEAYKYLSKLEGTVFFTTGSKNIGDFEKVRGSNRFIYRILPALESIEICRIHNVSIKDIIAILGPFSKEYNKLMFHESKADYVLMKDSGIRGGTEEKIRACRELGILPIIIGREEEEGINSLNQVEDIIRKHT